MTDAKIKELISTEVDKAVKAALASSSPGASSPTKLEVVTLQAGQSLMAGEGAEFIVRTGKTIAVSTDENGIPDVTSGKDIAAGTVIDLNHLLIFPREGRGIKVDAKEKNDVFIMVRGSYRIIKP
jgi:hypothetical protein